MAPSLAGSLARSLGKSLAGGSAPAFVGLLDQVSVAPNGAYSVSDKLRNAYAGAAYRCSRDSDGAELDIGFTAAGLVDTAAMAAHCAGTVGRVRTLYDQSGNNRDFGQATAANRPIVYQAGAVVVAGTSNT